MNDKIKILIIDDQAAPRESARMILKNRYNVATTEGAIEGYQYLAENPVDLIFIDIKMPNIDGITALREIKKKYPEVLVILFSGYITPEITQQALKLGAYKCLRKPFDKDDLFDTVKEALKDREGRGRPL
ncbi:MAG TPA: response regulator [Nitrospirae bacterium]|nr:transcriptional regulatory protein ZraR [bacterium BMS3Bbin08]HDH50882.1 response regulator [Nitrospirota bacterium]HDK17450.1 response regulator [Nitrospirota bacterium]HDO25258.1 response regulator [Nitrospirota bacterium]HDZ84475.1 response regulator [Nitrospirota bacterium]